MTGNSRSGTMEGSTMEDEGFHGAQAHTNGVGVVGMQSNSNGVEVDGVQPKTNGAEVDGGQPKTNGAEVNGGQPKTNGADLNGGQPKINGAELNGAQPYTNGTDVDSVLPLAIVGMACRLPDGVHTAEDLWGMCSLARSGWTQMPPDRFKHDNFYHPDPAKLGTYNAKGACFLQEDVGLFDAAFFNVTAQEAIAMDPQQRLLLECTYEALQNGGITKESIAGSNTGVFVGGATSDYDHLLLADVQTTPMYTALGCEPSILANRLSYFFDLRGPSLTIDTACSSSLVALHMACQSLRSGESSQAIVGGAHLNLLPDQFIKWSNQRLFSNEGKCFSFDERATSGYGRGEGIASLIIRPLKDALKARNPIRAVIVNSGMNQDGHTNGITLPNQQAQEQLIRSVYDKAGLDVRDTGYVEAHGTGTRVGDPIEAAALRAVFCQERDPQDPLLVGSVKANVGHLEQASGIVSVIKAALCLQKGFVPPNANFDVANSAIPLERWNLKVPKTQKPWPKGKKYASINNFGFGGANCHVVLSKPPPLGKPIEDTGDLVEALPAIARAEIKDFVPMEKTFPRFVFVMTAHTRKSLETQIKNLEIYLEQRPDVYEVSLMGDLAYTLCERRSFLPFRIATSATTSAELISRFTSPDLSPVRTSGKVRLGFVYTGQGAQWYAMGRELYAANPVFASAMQRAAAVIASLGASWSLIDQLYGESSVSQLGHAHISQPAVTAIQIALTAMLAAWDIHPSSVMGHSSGEIAASYAAGILSLESAMKVAYFRGLVTSDFKQQFPKLKGAMMAVGCTEQQLRPMLEKITYGKVVVAANNSPSSLTVSGDELAISELQQMVEDQSMFNRKLRVEMAYHSHHMELIAEKYLALLSGITPMNVSGVDFYSTVTGSRVKSLELEPTYWVANLVSRVRFSETLVLMCGGEATDGVGTLLEVGPHSALEGPIRQTLKTHLNSDTAMSYTSCLLRNKDAEETSMQLAAFLCMRGYPLNFEAVNDPLDRKSSKLLIDMPPYVWRHDERYWHESRITQNRRLKKAPRHDLLGSLVDESNEFEAEWRNVFRLSEIPWIEQHRVQSTCIFPFAGYVVMAMEAMRQRALSRNLPYHSFLFRDIAVARSMNIDSMIDMEVRTTLRPRGQGDSTNSGVWEELKIHSWTKDNGWLEHCRCFIGVQQTSKENSVDGLRQIQDSRHFIQSETSLVSQKCSTQIDTTVMYNDLHTAGLAFGEVFRGLQGCRASPTRSMAEVSAPDTASLMPERHESDYPLHPVTLDIIAQVLWPSIGAGRTGLDCLYLPTFIRELEISKELPETTKVPFQVYGCIPRPSIAGGNLDCSYFAMHPNHGDFPCIRAEGHRMTQVQDSPEKLTDDDSRALCYKLSWEASGPLDFESSDPVQQNGSLKCNGSLTLFTQEVEIVTLDGSQLSDVVSITKLFAAMKDRTGQSPSLRLLQDVPSEGKVVILLMELDNPCLSSLEPDVFERIKSVILSSSGIIWPIRGGYQESSSPDMNMVNGFARTVRAETALKFITIDLHQKSSPTDNAKSIAEVFSRAFVEQSPHAAEMEYMERSGCLHVPRLTPDAPLNDFMRLNAGTGTWGAHPQDFAQIGRPLRLTIERPGSLDSMGFVEDERLMSPIGNDEIEVDVKAVSLNFKDVVIAMGQLPGGLVGQECSGIVTGVGDLSKDFKVGDRVCAYSPGCLANGVRCKASSAICIPESMSFNLASTLPVVYCTAYYSLMDVGRLSKGEKILIHAAAGGVGQAALGIAQMVGAEVFATVGNESKKDFLMQNFGIDSDHIFYSRDTSFKAGIMRMTDNHGVDVVLNSLAGNILQTTLECLTSFGRFIEIGKRDIVENSRIEMAPFARNIVFASVDLAVVAVDRPSLMQRLLKDVMDLYHTDRLRLVSPLASLPISEVESAIRALQGGKTLGKLVIVPHPKDQVMASPPRIPQHLLPTSATYVIVGGTGGIGRSMAEWMIEKGARNLALISRSGLNEKLGGLMARATACNATIAVHKCDVANEDEVKTLFEKIQQEMPPIRGIIHSAMVLHDTLFEDLTYEQYQAIIRPKVTGVWNLHHALSKDSLDFFIALSSTSGIVGNRGQAAYAAANTFLDAFSQYRQSQGLPMTTIDLSAVKEIGYLAEDEEKAALVGKTLATTAVGEKELHCLLAAAIMGQMQKSCNGHCITGLGLPQGSDMPAWMLDPKFEHIRPATAEQQQQGSQAQKASLSESIQQSTNEKETLQLIQDALLDKVASVLMLPVLDIDPNKPITSYGLDSLIAIEIRNWIGRNCQASLQVLELLSSGTLVTLSRLIMQKSKLVPQVRPDSVPNDLPKTNGVASRMIS